MTDNDSKLEPLELVALLAACEMFRTLHQGLQTTQAAVPPQNVVIRLLSFIAIEHRLDRVLPIHRRRALRR